MAQLQQPQTKTQSQWAAFHITYTGSGSIAIKNPQLSWGRWYEYPDKDEDAASPDGSTVSEGELLIIAACGRAFTPTGAQGSFELWQGSHKIAKVNFDSPTVGSNNLRVTLSSTRFRIEHSDPPADGPLGDVKPLAISEK